MHAFVGHAFGHAQGLAHRAKRIAIPVVFQHPKDPFHRVILAVIGWVARQFYRHPLRRTELHQAFEPLGARPVVLRAVVRIQEEGMWTMTVFLSVGQISLKRSTMKSAVALPVVKLSQVSAVSGRWRPKGVSLSSGSRS